MARQVQMILLDDIDGGEATKTVTFALEGKNYEIDLNDANAERLTDAMAPFVAKARKTGAVTRRQGVRRSEAVAGNASEVRSWAREQGYEVSDRGRVPKEIRDAFDLAH